MLITAAPSPKAAAGGTMSRWRLWLRGAWVQFTLTDDDHFLQEACNLADLEVRLRRLERGRADRFSPLPPPP